METQIRYAQIDPNGLCNAGCWFCPVAYLGNPTESVNQMTPEEFRNVIKQIHDNKGGIVSQHFNGIYTSHYNEALLYSHFEEMLETLREFRLGMVVLTNGTPLTPKKTDIINKYQDVVWGVCVNAPIWTDKELFEKRTGMREGLFQRLYTNVKYAADNLKNKHLLSIQINGHDRESGALKGDKFPDITPEELDTQVAKAKELFPNVNVFKQPHLIDRAGLIDDYISSSPFIKKDKKVIGCQGKRDTEWLHINANSELFLCCNDYHMEYKYGNLKEHSLETLWMGEKHKQQLEKAYTGICATCTSAIFGD
jgi:hypothetical protein